ncbi:hypothetical protein TI05_09060 [Achromatium sp. WMS3]|nr:hypothetical protein TI05_09060 [Achromatium sp. WMS3]
MNQTALTKLDINQGLSFLPEPELQALKIIIDKMTNKSVDERNGKSLKGIWKDKGFEQLDDLNNALRQARKEINATILNRKI